MKTKELYIFKEKELSRKPTVAKFATVRQEGRRLITRDVEYDLQKRNPLLRLSH